MDGKQLGFNLAEQGAARAADLPEIWLPLLRFASQYEVSSLGNLRNSKSGLIKAACVGSSGYLTTDLYMRGQRAHCMIHRLVAEVFLPNPCRLPAVNHIDGVKTNNSAQNLEWVTYSENSLHSCHVLGNKAPVLHGTSNAQHRAVVRIAPDGQRTQFPTMTEAAKAGYDIRGIYAACCGEQRTHRGMRWVYITEASTASHSRRSSNIFRTTNSETRAAVTARASHRFNK